MSRAAEIAPAWRDWLTAADSAPLEALLDSSAPDAQFPGRWEALTKPGLADRERWRWATPSGAPDAVVFVKRYGAAPLRMQWDRIFRQSARHSRAFWEFARAAELASGRIGAPRAVGFVEQMSGMLEQRSAVLLTRVNGEPLDKAWLRCARENAPIARGAMRRDLAVRLGRFVAAFHGTGLCHRDLYLCHIFAELDPQGASPPRFALIDLARTHRPRLFRARWIIKDLAQLDSSARQIGLTRGDRLAFLRAYLGLERGAARVAWYVRSVVRKSNHILRRDERKRRGAADTPTRDQHP